MLDDYPGTNNSPRARAMAPNEFRATQRGTADFAFAGDRGSVDIDLARYLRVALKHRWIIAGAFLAALVIGVAVTLLSTPIYTATATLQIDRQAAQVLENSEVAPLESMIAGEEFFQTQYGLLRSRALAERVVDTLGLANSDAFLERMEAEPPAAEGARAAERLQ